MQIKSVKLKLVLQVIAFWMISFIVFSPTANIIFSTPQKIQAQSDISAIADGVTYTAAIPVCEAIAAVRQAVTKLWGSTTDVPSADSSAGGTTAGATMQTCYKEWGDKIKTAIVDALTYAAITAMHALLQEITNKIIKCIYSYDTKTGKCDGGDSLLVLDFNSLLKNAADVAGAKFLNDLTGVNLCSITPSLKLQIALLPVPEFKDRAACTLSDIVSNIDDFYDDFTQGDWLAWDESLKPNNDAFGAWLLASDEKRVREMAAVLKTDKEAKNGFEPTRKCLDPVGEDPKSEKCGISIITTSSGTVETAVNYSAMSPIRSFENNLAAMYSKMGPFGPYLTAITNALLNKITSTGLTALMNELSSSDLESSNPYQSIIDDVSENSGDYSTAQANQAYTNLMISTLDNLNTYISDYAKPAYFDLITTLTSIKNEQDTIMNNYWGQGMFTGSSSSSNATYSIASGPTTSAGTGTILEYIVTTYNVSHSQIGSAIIEKRVITYTDYTTSTTYNVISKQNQIEDIDGVLTTYTNKYNSVSLTQSQTSAAKTPTQTAYDKITTYLNSWDGTSGNTTAKSEMDTAIIDNITYFQTTWSPALTSSNLSGVSTDLTSLYNDTLSDVNSLLQNQTQSTYDDYLTTIQAITTDLSAQSTPTI